MATNKPLSQKKMLRTLNGETLDTPPIWLMRQAGRYLPEYKATRAQAGGFLDLCYNPDLATEVTLQPIRRFGFDAAILFADILLIPQALGMDLWFETGEGPRLTPIQSTDGLKSVDEIHETLNPIYETVGRLSEELPTETTLIGFAGAPWTVATYMIAGRGTPDQAPAHKLLVEDPTSFYAIIDRVADATVEYLSRQIDAGAEVVKLFDSWAGSLKGEDFGKACIDANAKVISKIKARHPEVKVIGFPRGATMEGVESYVDAIEPDAIAIGQDADRNWARDRLQPKTAVQGNLDPSLMVTGGDALLRATDSVLEDLGGGPHIFNLGHGITPDADPRNVEIMIKRIRS